MSTCELQRHSRPLQHDWTQHLQEGVEGLLFRVQGDLQRIKGSLQWIIVQTRNAFNQEGLVQIQVRVPISSAKLRNSWQILLRLPKEIGNRIQNLGGLWISSPIHDNLEIGSGWREEWTIEEGNVIQHEICWPDWRFVELFRKQFGTVYTGFRTSEKKLEPMQCDQNWRNFATLAKFYKTLAIYWGLVLFWAQFWTCGKKLCKFCKVSLL